MFSESELKLVIDEVKSYLKLLLSVSPCTLIDIPTTGGIYLVYNKNGEVIYVGKAVNLKRRIKDDHLGGDEKMSTSTLRRSISKLHNILSGQEVKKWMKDNCSFSYVAIHDHDTRDLVETLAIAYLRKQGASLLNFHRG